MITENTKITLGMLGTAAASLIGYGTLQARVQFLEDRADRQAVFMQKGVDKSDDYRERLMEKIDDIQKRMSNIEGQLKNIRLR